MTPILDIQNLTKTIGSLELFNNISFSVSEGQHVGLIARNGTGKSTLLNILHGDEDYDSGNIIFRRDITVGYLEQSPRYEAGMSVIDACFSKAGELSTLISSYEQCLATPGNPGLEQLIEEMERCQAWDFEQRAKQILTKLDIREYNKPIAQLSGGQLKRVALANALLTNPDLLILDEPTNHLDIGMIEWLETYLQRSSKALLMVTHDRYFLDRVCSITLELDENTLYTYRGNYEYYLEKREERLTATNANIARAQNLYRKELDWMRRMPSARGTKARYRKEAFSELEKQAKRHMEERTARLEVKSGYIGSKIFEAEYVSKKFPTESGEPKIILKDFYYNFSRYEKMGIVGANGTGKSTFIKMLLGKIQPDSGRFVIGQTVRFGYFSQEDIPFDKQKKVIDAVREIAETIDLGGGRHLTATQFLTHFLFPPKRQQDYIYKLSGGERRRLQLCITLMTNPNFLILDEPTNDLDIPTLQILEEYLMDFKGCVIIVSHDRYFMDKVVDHLLVFNGNGNVDDFPGNYTQYRQWLSLKEKEEMSVITEKKQVVSNRNTRERPRKLTFKERQEMTQLEKDIAVLEAEKKQTEEALCSGLLPVDQLTEKSKRFPLLLEELEDKTMRWLELSELE
ncbi:energy-dependent translational throttle protein EttA [Bacteroidaceae bacterium]|uniref:ribosomal protection-like ABC-F family protein n=1 Tax=Prevotella sp. MGM2 TaxID=2033406 RepID=UPI000CEA54F7|nr:ABC-F family ATP-binding cassette domain-containing protein [Prevotella sp. MGM2]GAY30207.1 ABC transporter ATP-binding protein [Prevotella sp. MGM2]GFI34796.1 energy-dependent translational throttle protein EttA [Bacteroidaceae bacterium]